MGTVKGITDSGGTLINRTEYDSFGGILSHSNPAVADRFGFTGREHDPETGLIYYRARWYEPSLGRFLSEDSVGFAAADTNLRRYVFGSPMMGVDPSGLITTADYAKLKSAVVAAGKQCAQALGITLAEKGVEIGIYMFLAEAQVYVGQTLDDFDVRKNRHIARLKDQGIKLVKEAFEPILRVAPGTAKAKIRELEEFFIKYLVRNLEEIERTGSANILNRRHEIKKGTKLSCDDFVDKVL
jgi:RHS repeat-associated protein